MTEHNSYQEFFASQCRCKGRGFLEIWNPGGLTTLGGNPDTRDTVVVVCPCTKGKSINESKKKPLHEYDQFRHRLVSEPKPEFVAAEIPADAYANQNF